ncbi:MAG: right-handed parallel beta-helix repeat-containing protein [Betaproteobacteria bacterium]
MKKQVSAIVLLITLASLLFTNYISVNAETPINGIITSNTTWTKTNSPYTLQGPVAVNQGVTLTIEPGVTINLNNHYIQVNGTLLVRGTDNEKIVFDGGLVTFTSISQQTGQASTIENVVADSLAVWTSMTITKCTIKGLDVGSSVTVIRNTIESLSASENAVVTNNEITQNCHVGGSAKITSNNIDARVIVNVGSTPTISNNKISDGVHIDSNGARVTVSGNEIHAKNAYPRIFVAGSHAEITNNLIVGSSFAKPVGISVGGYLSSATITGNQIYNCQTGITVQQSAVEISKNVIANCEIAVNIMLTAPISGATPPYNITPIVEVKTNTIAKNTMGIIYQPYDATSTITGNNIYDNTEYNFKLLQYMQDINIPNNWWGTTDTTQISQKIYDYQADFNLGHVIVDPVLTSPASGAPTIPANIPSDTPQPTAFTTPNPTQNLTTTPSQPANTSPTELNIVEIAILAVLVVIAFLLAVLIITLRRKK